MSNTEIINNIDSNMELINYLLQKISCGIASPSDRKNLEILQENLSRLNAIQANTNIKSRTRVKK